MAADQTLTGGELNLNAGSVTLDIESTEQIVYPYHGGELNLSAGSGGGGGGGSTRPTSGLIYPRGNG